MKNKSIILIIFLLSLVLGFGIFFANRSFADPLEDHVEVEPNTELKYFIDVVYDGKDINSVESNNNTLSNVNSKVINVSDILPEGLTFKGFVTTSDGTIGAEKISDQSPCAGSVVDDTKESSNDTGVWNSGNTEYTYHGLHYNANTREVTFKVKNLKAGCKLTVGVLTQTPASVDDPNTTAIEKRRDFYNHANGKENEVSVRSNTVHVYMGSKNETMYNVIYEYTGTVPSNATELPDSQSYSANTKVGVSSNASANGYTFSGWSTTDATISNGTFTMPSDTVYLRGSFTAQTPFKVTYAIDGTMPEDYEVPKEKTYFADNTVNVDSLKPGDVINGFKFLGWETEDVEVTSDNDFTMPNKNITFTGKFTEQTFKVEYKFYDTVLPPNSDSLLPNVQEYRAGVTVNLENVKSEPNGYRFLGWYKEDPFEMPNKDVVIYGEWMQVNGEFEPTITKEITNLEDSYKAGDVVEFKITVTNTANYPIKEVILKELMDDVEYVAGSGYTIDSEHFVTINNIPANGSVDVSAKYTVKNTDKGTLKNEVILIGALADNHYILKDKEYKASVDYLVASRLNINKVDEQGNPLTGAEFTIYSDQTLENVVSTGLSFVLAPGTYYLKETKAPSGYVLESKVYTIIVDNTGNITVTGETLTNDSEDANIKILTVTNRKINMLPNTGGIGTYIYIFGGLGLMLLGAIGAIILSRKEIIEKEAKKNTKKTSNKNKIDEKKTAKDKPKETGKKNNNSNNKKESNKKKGAKK